MSIDGPVTRRNFCRAVALGLTSLILPVSSGCAPQFSCDRDRWYGERRGGFLNCVGSNDPRETLMKRVICSAADKLAVDIHPGFLEFPRVSAELSEPKRMEDKKELGIVDIYIKDQQGISILADFITDMMVRACMTNVTIGENFNLLTRYKIKTLLSEYDLRKGIQDFDPRDAIKRGFFKGADAIVTGSIYTSESKHIGKGEERREVYGGGAQIVLQMIDVETARIVGGANESISRDPLVDDWIKRQVQKRY